MSADTTPGLEAGRAAFEQHAHERGYTLTRGPNDSYQYRDAAIAWRAWQAARRAPAPAPQGPTDAELIAFQEEEQYGLYCDPDDFVDIARAVLARWGAPAASGEPVARKPLTDEQINELADQCRAPGHGSVWPHAFAKSLEAAHGIKP